MDMLMTKSNNGRDNDIEPVLEQYAVPLDVRLQIAETRKRMAESRYRLSVTRALAWVDKSRGLVRPANVDR